MPYLIDGNNMMARRVGWHRNIQRARRQLLEELAWFAMTKGVSVSVVFDGAPDPFFPDGSRYRGITVFYAMRWSNADERIKALVERSRDRQTLIVVTSDRTLADYVRRCGVQVISCDQFRCKVEELSARSDEDRPIFKVEDDLDEWMRYFGVGPEDDP
ncbi:NYN domain-containing protein [Pyrinomonas sp.]|uniref:NYN domain-containing protein n=1 Tax=Pyrinomonas sp. TaxID=2080306 RepID=UPI0033238499